MSREGGFTLIEILVVLAIIAVLIGAVALGIPYATRQAKISETKGLIGNIEAALKLVESPQGLGEYPPTSTLDLQLSRKKIGKEIGQPNDFNVGSETLAIVLFLKDSIAGTRIETKYLVNTDGDVATEQYTTHATLALFEIRDAWDNPMVYIHHNDYETAFANGLEYVLADGITHVTVRPKKDPTTGSFYRLDSFQLFSLGPDENDDADDIGTFLR